MFCLKYQWPWCPAYWPRCPLIIFKSQGQLALPSNCPNSRPATVLIILFIFILHLWRTQPPQSAPEYSNNTLQRRPRHLKPSKPACIEQTSASSYVHIQTHSNDVPVESCFFLIFLACYSNGIHRDHAFRNSLFTDITKAIENILIHFVSENSDLDPWALVSQVIIRSVSPLLRSSTFKLRFICQINGLKHNTAQGKIKPLILYNT